MSKSFRLSSLLVLTIFFLTKCTKNDTTGSNNYPYVTAKFGNNLNLKALANYSNQGKPIYIVRDNTGSNTITDAKATLGRVLFYDKALSIDNSISCANCHKQNFAFSDDAPASTGVLGGSTARHAMRLINSRFSDEVKFFWDERAATLEEQTTKPIQDHAEMGFSGLNGRDNMQALIIKLQALPYYIELFTFVYADKNVTEPRLQECLAQFIRSIQSFDSKYDAGRVQVNNDNQAFPNFTAQENTGKNLFLTAANFDAIGNRIGGGLGCGGCHRAPDFNIDPNSRNNGIIGRLNATGIDITNTKSPTLRDLTNPSGLLNGPLMHTAGIPNIQAAIGHYGTINVAAGNNNLDPRLRPNGFGQQLHLTGAEVNAVIAFINTLNGVNVYTDKKWSNPFL